MPSSEHPSPDGRYMLSISPIPMRMSHEIDSPLLVEQQSNSIVFDPGNLWDAGGIRWSDDSRTLSMGMRLYPDGNIGFELVLDLAGDRATLTREGKVVVTGTLAQVEQKMKTTYAARDLKAQDGPA